MDVLNNQGILKMLKRELSERWPDAPAAIRQRSHPDHEQAVCLWVGLKKGFELGYDFVHSPLEALTKVEGCE